MLRIIFKKKAPALVKKQQLEEAYGIRLTEDETKELSKMCNLSEGLYNNGQQFTAFKPLAHRPKPMLAKP